MPTKPTIALIGAPPAPVTVFGVEWYARWARLSPSTIRSERAGCSDWRVAPKSRRPSSSTALRSSSHPAGDRASAYGLPKIVIDGNDADAVFRAAQTAYAKARAGQGPSLIECITYRHSGHSRADPGAYRPKGELERWKKEKDPINIYRERMAQFGIGKDVIAKIETEVNNEVEAATEACKAAPNPPMDILFTDVYADGGWAWRN